MLLLSPRKDTNQTLSHISINRYLGQPRLSPYTHVLQALRNLFSHSVLEMEKDWVPKRKIIILKEGFECDLATKCRLIILKAFTVLCIPENAWPLFSHKVPYMPFPPLVFNTSSIRALLQKEGNLHTVPFSGVDSNPHSSPPWENLPRVGKIQHPAIFAMYSLSQDWMHKLKICAFLPPYLSKQGSLDLGPKTCSPALRTGSSQ